MSDEMRKSLKLQLLEASYNNRYSITKNVSKMFTEELIKYLSEIGLTVKLVGIDFGFKYRFSWKGDVSKCIQAI